MPTVTEGIDSYVSEERAAAYFSVRLYADAWDNATDENRQKALLMSRVLLDGHIRWKGRKTDLEQALEWPRAGVDSIGADLIPDAVRVAQMELALVLLAEDVTAIPETSGFSEIQVNKIRLKIDPNDRRGVIPESVFALVSNLGRREGGCGTISLGR